MELLINTLFVWFVLGVIPFWLLIIALQKD
jgi:hypothetical protein